MFLQISVLLFLSFYVTKTFQQDLDACSLVEEPMYCTCDVYGFGEAHQISCFVVEKSRRDDLFWNGFKGQLNIKDLTITSTPGSELDYMPVHIIRPLHQLERFTMREGALENLATYTFVNMSLLRVINLERNMIQTLEFNSIAYLPNLTELVLTENSIRRLPASTLYKLPLLEKLHLDRNNMTIIDDLAFVELPNLSVLNLWENHLHHLSSKTFVGLRSLKTLELSRNHLSRLDDGVFSGAPGLRDLDLMSNHISSVNLHAFDGLNNLKILRLGKNRIKVLQDNIFKGTPRLEQIYMSHNKLTTFREALLLPLTVADKPNFTIHLKGNHLNCSCELLWMAEMAITAPSHQFRRELHDLQCRFLTSPQKEILASEAKQTHQHQSDHHPRKDHHRQKSHHHKRDQPPQKNHQHENMHIVNLTARELSCAEITTTSVTTQPTEAQPTELKPTFLKKVMTNPNMKEFPNPILVTEEKASSLPNVEGPIEEPTNSAYPQMAASRNNNVAAIPTVFPFLILLSQCLAIV